MTRILVVEDSFQARELIKDILAKHGIEDVTGVESGEEAINRYKLVEPDLVILDLMLPEMDGVEALKEIKMIDEDAKVIVTTARRSLEEDCMEAGAEDYIVKPFSKDKIWRKIRKYL